MGSIVLGVEDECFRLSVPLVDAPAIHVGTNVIHKLGFNQNHYIFTLILLIKIVLCSEFP